MEYVITIIFFALIIRFAVWYYISQEFYEIAKEKGYSEKKYLWITFFLGIIGALLIAAMPDRGNITVSKTNTEKSNKVITENIENRNENSDFSNMNNLEKLEYYKMLLDSGKITETEFVQMRKTLISQ